MVDSRNYYEVLYVSIHELGHALGVEHNEKSDIKYEFLGETTSLTLNDMKSYDKAATLY